MKMLRNFSLAFLALSCNAIFAADEGKGNVTALFEHLNEGIQPGAAVMVIKDVVSLTMTT